MRSGMTLEPDEPAAGPWHVVPLEDLVERVRAAAGTPVGRPRIVAVDGRGGAGKSSLVERLRLGVPGSVVVHTDDVAWHHSFFDWAGLLAEHVLAPLRRGEAVDYRPHAWVERGRPGSIVVPAGVDTVWVEGTGVLRAELRPLLDAAIWVQVDRLEAERRLRHRDGDDPAHLRLVEDWSREERSFLRREEPWAWATVIVAGSLVVLAPDGHVAIALPRAGSSPGGRHGG